MSGQEIIPPIYEGLTYKNAQSPILVCKDGHCGFIYQNQKVLIPLKYDKLTPFSKGMSVVSIDGKVGCIDTLGNFILPMEYDGIQILDSNLIAASKNCLWQLLRRNGEVAHTQYFRSVSTDRIDDILVTLGSEEFFVLDNAQKTYLSPRNNAFLLYNKLIIPQEPKYLFSEAGKYGLLTQDATVILPCIYDEILGIEWQEGLYNIVKQHNRYGLFLNSQEILPIEYESIKYKKETLQDSKGKNIDVIYFYLQKDEKKYVCFFQNGVYRLKEM